MPLYDVTFPFIRMVQGPVDYTPGAYRNATREGFRIDYRNPMSQGTRAHQVAAYVVFDAPLVMLCDSPTRYMADEACTRFIASLPVVFDTTRVLAGEIGEYIVTARKRQDCWYVGGLTGWTPRTLDVDLSLLDPGREYTATLLADDGRSAAEPARYALSTQRVTSATRLQITLSEKYDPYEPNPEKMLRRPAGHPGRICGTCGGKNRLPERFPCARRCRDGCRARRAGRAGTLCRGRRLAARAARRPAPHAPRPGGRKVPVHQQQRREPQAHRVRPGGYARLRDRRQRHRTALHGLHLAVQPRRL